MKDSKNFLSSAGSPSSVAGLPPSGRSAEASHQPQHLRLFPIYPYAWNASNLDLRQVIDMTVTIVSSTDIRSREVQHPPPRAAFHVTTTAVAAVIRDVRCLTARGIGRLASFPLLCLWTRPPVRLA